MKRKNLFVKIVALLFCAVFSFVSLFACKQMDEINNKVDDIDTELDNKVDKETYDTLSAFVNEIDAIAKAAVSTEAFEQALIDLNASIATKANTVKVSQDIEALKSALEGMIKANSAADAETKTALDAALVRVTALEGSVATQAALDAAVKAINDAVSANKTSADAELAALRTLINNNGTADAALLAQVDALTATVAQNKTDLETAINTAKENLQGQINKVSEDLTALTATVDTNNKTVTKALNDAKAELNARIDAVDKAVDNLEATVAANNKAINERVDAVVNSVDALDKTVKDNYQELLNLKDKYTNDKAALDKIDNDNKAAIDAINEELAELKAADKANSDAIAAAEAELIELKAADAKNAKDIADLKAAYEKKVAALEKADADNKAELITVINGEVEKLNTEIAKNANAIAALQTAVADINGDIEDMLADINTVKGSVTSIKNELDGKISTLRNEYEAFVESTNDEISGIKSLIESIETQIETLHSNSDSFAEKYQAATDELYNGEYSVDNFNAKVAEILAEDYAEQEYKEFEEAVERLRFFLNRAISVDAIKGYFEELDAIIEEMPTLVESLTDMLNAYTENAPEGKRKYLTTDAGELDSIKTVYNKIDTVEQELQALYDDIVAAHNNLLAAATAAEDVKNDISNIAAPIVYTDSEPAIVYAENAFAAYSEAYFADAETTKYYGVTDAAALVTNYGKLEEYRARYDALTVAAAEKVVFSDVVLNYEAVRPLWNQLATITDDVAKYDAWLADNEIDETVDAKTIANIYAGELELLDKALAYATYMDGVYSDNGVEALVLQIGEYVANAEVLYETKDACDAFNAAREDVKAAIEAATDYAADDKNYTEMLGEELLTKLAEVTVRIDELVEAKAAIDAVDEDMKALLGNVTINSYETIKNYRVLLDELYADYGIVVNDGNYVALATAAEADYTALIAEYNEATAAVAAAYVSVRTRLDAVKWLLKDGHEIPGLVADLKDLIRQGVTNVNLIFESGDIQVDIPMLFEDYLVAATEYKENATAVAVAAASVNAAIEGLDGKVFTDVKLNAEIIAVYNEFVAWTDAYLAEDIAVATDGVRAAIEAIQGITIYGSNPEAAYAFVTLDNYDLLVEAYNTAVASYEAAGIAWDDIETDMLALADYDIHSYEESELNFVAVKAAYDAYVETYYNGSIDESTQQFNELTTVGDFNTDMGNCFIALNNAQAAADEINGKIDNLGDITMGNADDVLLEIADIEALIANYQATYCDGQCNITEERFFALRKARAVAEVSSAYNVVYNAAAVEEQPKILEAYLMFVDDGMGNSENDAELKQFRDMAESQIA